jgi:hypothetical protein
MSMGVSKSRVISNIEKNHVHKVQLHYRARPVCMTYATHLPYTGDLPATHAAHTHAHTHTHTHTHDSLIVCCPALHT